MALDNVGQGLRQRLGRRLSRVVITLILVIGAFVALFPVYYTAATAFKTTKGYALSRFAPPREPTLENFRIQFRRFAVGRLILNSAITTSGGVLLCTIVSLMVAYAVTKVRFPGRNLIFAFLVGTLVIPFPTIMVPVYQTVLDLKMMDQYYGLILAYSAFGLPLGVYLLGAYFRGIPDEIVEAARMDGASHWQTIWQVMFPISRPGVAALGIINSVWMWNDLLLPLLILPSAQRTTLMVAVTSQRNNLEVNIPIISAGLTIAMIPILVVYLMFQRQLIKGMTAGAVK
ncbi:MAG: carbohydrate ABC transporter permease [Spirochaetales bacterium]|nr:carbohydrate ABC transporter permease [Spirochaetales bacterium]